MISVEAGEDGLTFGTTGLNEILGCEISATVIDAELSDDCKRFVLFVTDYVLDGYMIHAGETIGYGYWIAKAVANDRGDLEFWEYDPEATDFIPGISNTLRYWHDQHEICGNVGSEFAPPRADQMIVISEGVYDGDEVQGVRYPSPPHMSGWWITTDRYDGNVGSLKTVHAYHLTARRRDLAKFLALANGYRFHSGSGDVRFDQHALSSDGA